MNEYFAPRVQVTEQGCWEWQLFRNKRGYGAAVMRARYRRPVGAHRLSYEMHVGPIPTDMTVDHLCFNPPCVNPDHLRLLTNSENAANQRDAHKTHCKRGHELTPDNTRIKSYGSGRRDCKTCHRDRERLARQRRTAHLPRRGPARGERNPRAVLTEQDVIAIRRKRVGGQTVSSLAREYGVSRRAIQAAVSGATWAHVEFRPREDRPAGAA